MQIAGNLSTKDYVLAVLSLAANEGRTRVKLLALYKAFADLADERPAGFPRLVFLRTSRAAYSRRFDAAVQDLIGYGIKLPDPTSEAIEIDKESARRHLARLRKRYGQEQIERLRPVAEQFVKHLTTEENRTDPTLVKLPGVLSDRKDRAFIQAQALKLREMLEAPDTEET